jgi:indolepyruvate decarboxylase
MADGNFDNMLACYREFTVAQARIEPVHAIEQIDRVLRACWIEKRPVYLQLPSDVAGVQVPPITTPLDLATPPSDSVQLSLAVQRIAQRLSQARKPVFLVDADADRFGLTEWIIRLAEANAIPMAYMVPAKGVIDETHPLTIGMYNGAGSPPAIKDRVEGSDCLICVGTRFTDVSTGFFSHKLPEGSVIELNPYSIKIDGETLYAIDARELLTELLAASPLRIVSSAVEPPRKSLPPAPFHVGRELTQTGFWQHIAGFLQPRDIITADSGTSFFALAGMPFPKDVTFIGQPIWASIGYGLPAVLGSCLAAPNRRQLLFIGDGAFQMTAQELSTLLRLDLKPIIFLLNNDGYTIERLIFGANSSYNDIHSWRYHELPAVLDKANRAISHLVRTEDELQAALETARDTAKLNFIEVVLPRMDAPEPLKRLAQKAANFDFPQIRRIVDQTPASSFT